MTNDIGRITLGKQLLSRIPVTIGAADLLAHDDGEPAPEPIAFDPVPRRRNRRRGWSEQVQRDLIACLQCAGCVSVSSRAVGRSASSAYRLLTVEGAESFALAWDQAVREGLDRLREDALDCALNGSLVPLYRKGRLIRIEHRRNDALNRHAYAMK